jgi:hypothetical protein
MILLIGNGRSAERGDIGPEKGSQAIDADE